MARAFKAEGVNTVFTLLGDANMSCISQMKQYEAVRSAGHPRAP